MKRWIPLWTLIGFIFPLLAQDTQGFFLKEGFVKKRAQKPPYKVFIPPPEGATALVVVNPKDTLAKVSKYIYGNNANIYTTQMVNHPTWIQYIRMLSPHILRYPGGNISNQFFWNRPLDARPEDVPDSLYFFGQLARAEYWYGKSNDTLNLSVDNYYRMLKMTKSTGLICVNYAYARYGTGANPVQAAAHLAADWVRYDKGRTKFWEIGNENFGTWQAGYLIDSTLNQEAQPRLISGELYGRHFLVFADSMRKAAREVGADIQIGAGLVELPRDKEWYNPVERDWNDGFLKIAGHAVDFFSIHSYFTPYNENSDASTILESAGRETGRMIQYMKQLCQKHGIPIKPVALTEWNIFAVGSKQQTSFINGLHAVLVLGELIRHHYGMAARWNLANRYEGGNDHGMFNFGDEPGVPRWNPRPVFFTMYYFQKFFGDHMVKSDVLGTGEIVSFASRFSSGEVGVIVVNKSTRVHTVVITLQNFTPGKRYYFYSLTGDTDNGEFSQRVFVNGVGPDYATGGPIRNLEKIPAWGGWVEKGIRFSSLPRSVQYVLIEGK